MPKVSVIIPSYNHARFLPKRIESVLGQTYQDFELLYLDDASTDDSNAVFARYAGDPRIRTIINEVNSGSPFKQWNTGVRAARGEYIWLAESDDYADPTLLARLVSTLDKNPDVGLAYCQSWLVDEADAITRSAGVWTEDLDSLHWKADYVNRGHGECRQFLVHQNTIPNASAVVFRRKVYEEIGYADESFRLCGDWMLWIKMLLVSNVAFVAAPLNYFREHPSTVRHNAMQNGTLLIERYRIIAYLSEHLSLPPSVLNRAYQDTLDNWFHILLYLRGTIPAKRNLEIFRLARQSDHRLIRRVGRKFLPHYLRVS